MSRCLHRPGPARRKQAKHARTDASFNSFKKVEVTGRNQSAGRTQRAAANEFFLLGSATPLSRRRAVDYWSGEGDVNRSTFACSIRPPRRAFNPRAGPVAGLMENSTG